MLQSATLTGKAVARRRTFRLLGLTLILFGIALTLPVGTLASMASAEGGWHVQNASSAGSNASLDSVTFVDAEHGWALGGTNDADHTPIILATSDGGVTWKAQDVSIAGSGASLSSITFVDAKRGWAVGSTYDETTSPWFWPLVLATADGGVNWRVQDTDNLADGALLSSVAFADADHGWAVGSADGGWYDGSTATVPLILATSDGGATWSVQDAGPVPSLDGSAHLRSVSFVDTDHGWAAGWTGAAYHESAIIVATSDGGATWRAQESSSPFGCGGLYSVTFIDAQYGWAVGGAGGEQNGSPALIRTSDGGVTWRNGSPPKIAANSFLSSVSFADAQHGWAVGTRNRGYTGASPTYVPVILATSDGGVTWKAQDARRAGEEGRLGSVTFIDAAHGWVVGSREDRAAHSLAPVILATSNGGVPTPKPLVVLIGGLGSDIPASGGDWTFVKQRLEKAGYKDRVFVAKTHPGLPPGDTSDVIDSESPDWRDSAARLDHQLSAAGFKNRDLVLVGHSMGGLIARVYAANWEIPGSGCRPLGIVQLGTPNKGSKAANLAIGPLKSEAADRLADDASMAAFNAEFPNAEALPIYRIAGSYFPKSAGAYVAKQVLTPKKQNLLAAVLATIVGVYGTAYNDSVVTVDSVRGGPTAGWQGCTVFKAVHNNAKWLLWFRDDCGCVLPRRSGKKGAAAIDQLIMTQIIKDVRGVERSSSAAYALPSRADAPLHALVAGPVH